MRIAFLDEIFKASSSILNALLTILNERKYHNGAEVQDVPMQALMPLLMSCQQVKKNSVRCMTVFWCVCLSIMSA